MQCTSACPLRANSGHQSTGGSLLYCVGPLANAPCFYFIGTPIFARTSFSKQVRTASLFCDRLFIRINDLAALVFWRIDNDLRSRKSSTVLPLMFWNWAASVRSSAHSPCLPNFTSPTTVLNVVLRI